MVNSPGFPGSYWNNFNSCLAEIIGPPGSVITLEFVTFSVEPGDEGCRYDKVEVMSGYQNWFAVFISCQTAFIFVLNW